jgi:hypothetical protein
MKYAKHCVLWLPFQARYLYGVRSDGLWITGRNHLDAHVFRSKKAARRVADGQSLYLAEVVEWEGLTTRMNQMVRTD